VKVALRLVAVALVLGTVPAAYAQEGRAFNPIARPAARAALPDGAVRVTPPRSISRERIERAVATVAAAWNDRRVGEVLSRDFPRAQELADAMQTRVPRDASLRVLAIQGWRVLDQYALAGKLVSKVSITLRTQVEFNDAASGFQAREGVNEYVLKLSDPPAP
jgi:hypothetical protein